MSNPIYVVSGTPRTGTSMMMRALMMGGIEAIYEKMRNEEFKKKVKDGVYFNRHGVFELSKDQLENENFDTDYEGKLVKLLSWAFQKRDFKAEMKVVFMIRDPKESSVSMRNFRQVSNPTRINDVDKAIVDIKNRENVSSFVVFEYSEVLENPKKCFEKLKKEGWNINVDECIKTIDPDLRHYNYEKDKMKPEFVTISGTVKVEHIPLPGVRVLLNTIEYIDITDREGKYSFKEIPVGSSGKVFPTLSGYDFKPPFIEFEDIKRGIRQNFDGKISENPI